MTTTPKYVPKVHRWERSGVVVFSTCEENHLVRGAKTRHGKTVEWEGCSELGATPLMAGGRIIAPEEIDLELCRRLGQDPLKVDWKSVDLTARADTPSAPIEELCYCIKPSGNVWIPLVGDAPKEKCDAICANPRAWRDSLVVRRLETIREIFDACAYAGKPFEVSNGLCCLNRSSTFCVAKWMGETSYCYEFECTSMFDITHIESEHFNIVVATFDTDT